MSNSIDEHITQFINTKIGKNGHIKTHKDIIYQSIKELFIQPQDASNIDKKEWIQIHSDKLVGRSKNNYLHHLLEQDKIAEIPFRVFKITETIDTHQTANNPKYDNACYFIKSQISALSYQIYMCFQSGIEYMINFHEDNQHFLLFDHPELYSYYRILVLSTGKYVIYISRKYIEHLIENQHCDLIFVSLIKHHQIQNNIEFNVLNNKNIPCALNFPVKNAIDLSGYYAESLKESMFPHQIDNISWMVYLEKLINLQMTHLNYVNTQGLIEFKIGRDTYYTDRSYKKVYNRSSLVKTPRQESILMRGGILADDAGMGKTRSIIGLILTDILLPSETTPYLSKQQIVNYMRTDDNEIDKGNYTKNEPTETNEVNICLINDNDPKGDEIEKFSLTQLLLSGNYYLGQTLVIAPSHVIDIWQEEISETSTLNISYVMLSNITHIKKLKPKSIGSYNLIILSNNLLLNRRYHEHIKTHLDVDFRNYYWRRVVVDEADDILRVDTHQYSIDSKTNSISNYVNGIKSITRWCVSSNPFQFKESNLGGYLSFLCDNVSKHVVYNLDLDDIKKIIRCYIRRHNKKELIANENLPIPTIKEEVVYLKQSKIEKAIYRTALRKYNKLRLMQLCTHVQVSEEETKMMGKFAGHKIMTLDEIEDSMMSYYQTKINKLGNKNNSLVVLTKDDKKYREKLVAYINHVYLKETDSEILIDPLKLATIIKESIQVQYIYSLLDDYLNEYHYSQIISSLEDCDIDEIWTVLHINHEIDTKHDEQLTEQNKTNQREIETLKNQMGLFKQNYISESVKEHCFICYEQFDKVIITECRHIFCGNCMKGLFQNKDRVNCPLCRRVISSEDIKVTDIKLIEKAEQTEPDGQDINKYGTKIAYLIKKARELLETSDHRIIICSQWMSMLVLIANVLLEFQINHLIAKENCTNMKSTMAQFENNDNNIRVLLITPESCVMGNDLTSATHIIMTDVLMMHKNNAKIIENQLSGYVQRIGQTKEVSLIKLVMKGTIEEEYHRKQN